MIRILYFIPVFGTGGTERLVLDLCRLLDQEAFNAEVSVFTTGSFEQELQKIGKKVHTIAGDQGRTGEKSVLRKLQDFRSRCRTLASLLDELKPDILHTHHIGPLLHLLPLRNRMKNVSWIHTEHIRPDIDRANNPPRILSLAKYAFRLPDRVTGVSEAVGEYFRTVAHVPEKNVTTILNGVDVDAFSRAVAVDVKRRELGFSSDDFLVGTIGNLRQQKNHRSLLLAFSMIAAAHPRMRLLLAGDGEFRGALESLAHEKGIASRVHFLGHRLDAPEIMAVLDLYCLPSFYEGMPLSVLEAWSAGKPVVATDVVGIREIVRHDVNGVLVPSDRPEMLAQALLRVMGDGELRETISRNGQRFAMAECGIRQMVRRYEQLYRQVAAR
jgi:L-malate glycosyltransferase